MAFAPLTRGRSDKGKGPADVTVYPVSASLAASAGPPPSHAQELARKVSRSSRSLAAGGSQNRGLPGRAGSRAAVALWSGHMEHRTKRHANRILIEGDPIPLRLTRSRTAKAAK